CVSGPEDEIVCYIDYLVVKSKDIRQGRGVSQQTRGAAQETRRNSAKRYANPSRLEQGDRSVDGFAVAFGPTQRHVELVGPVGKIDRCGDRRRSGARRKMP